MISRYIKLSGLRNTFLLLRWVSSRPVFRFADQKKTTVEHNANAGRPESAAPTEKPLQLQEMMKLLQALQQRDRVREEEVSQAKLQSQRNKQQLSSAQRKFSFVLFIYTVALGIIIYQMPELYAINAQAKKKKEERKKEQALLEKYGTKELEVKPYYVRGNSIEQYFRSQLKHSGDIVRIYSGMSGIGKSAALRFLVNEMRQQGKRVFYCNLREQDDETPKNKDQHIKFLLTDERMTESHQKTFKIFKELPGLMDLAESRSSWTKRSVLIIDDANLLGELETYFKKQTLLSMYLRLTNLPHYGVDVFIISSSSSYCQKAKRNKVIEKKSRFQVVQQKNPEEKRKQIESIMHHYSMGDYKQTIDYFCDQGHSLRRLVQQLPAGPNEERKSKAPFQSDDQLLKHLQQRDGKLSGLVYKTIDYEARISKIDSYILRAIIKQSERVQDNDCISLIMGLNKGKLESQKYDTRKFSQFSQKLEQQNLFFYCHPRSNFIRRVFERKIKEMEQGQRQNR